MLCACGVDALWSCAQGGRSSCAQLPTANRGGPASVKPVTFDSCDATPVNARCGAAPVCGETTVVASPDSSHRGVQQIAAAVDPGRAACMLTHAAPPAQPCAMASAFAAGLPSRLQKHSASPGVFAGLDLRQELPVGAHPLTVVRPPPTLWS